MVLRIGKCVALGSLLVFTLTDGSGQDARFYGRRADHEFFKLGKAQEALDWYQRAYRAAGLSSDSASQTRLLNNIGAMQLTLFRYQDAEQTLLRVRKRAQAAHDDAMLGSVDGNLAAVYAQLDDLPTAEMYARESLQAYSRMGVPKDRPRAILTLASILCRQQLFEEGNKYFLEGIVTAERLQDWTSASSFWRHFGQVLLENGQLDRAGHAFAESRRFLSKSPNMKGEDALLWNISRLRLRQKNLSAALEAINSAVRIADKSGARVPTWRLYETRAEVELARGDAASALYDARTALQQARAARANVIPDNDNRVGAEGLLDEAFSVLIDAGNRVYLETHDPALLRETFEASEENRAQSLEALLPTASDWRAHLPAPQYWDKLSELVAEERVAVRFHSGQSVERLARLRSELAAMEAAAKATVHAHVGSVLDRVRRNLPSSASLLSFRMGNRASWLWAVDRDELQLIQLQPKAALTAEIQDFQRGIGDNDPETIARSGRRLYAHLFSGLDAAFERSPQWFISADEPLYTVPLAALVVELHHDRPVYLAQRKTLQILPGAQLFEPPVRGSLANKRFVAAGDGIYNRADPRYNGPGLVQPASWSMARLPASGAEVRFAAALWRNTTVLTGAGMNRESLIKEMDRDPDVIHIASHVIVSQDRWRAGILALGVDKAGEPDLLTPQEILLHSIHSRLVVMTGCSSGGADSLPASGLMGLTRAWLAAGAGEVLATRWPTKDEDEDGLIGSFYMHLLASPAGDIPYSLRRAREDMIARGGWRAEPRYWSSFFLIGVR